MDSNFEELYKWVEEHSISRPKRNISRDFSDAVPLVEILKHHFPKLVEVHNYASKNAYAQKLINWETLNTKVLKKLNLHLTKKRIEQLAKGESGIIEKLLLDVKRKIEAKSAGDDNADVYYLEPSPNPMSRLQNSGRRRIPVAEFEKMKSDLVEKSEAVDILKNKLDHLEQLLSMKDERINDLLQQVESMTNQTKIEQPGSKFFGFFQSANSIALPEPVKEGDL